MIATKFLTTTNKTATSTPVVTKAPIKRGGRLLTRKNTGTNVLIFGETGTGKTYTIVELLKIGVKVLLVSADFGESGADTIVNALRGTKDEEKLVNCYEHPIANYDEMDEFLKNPIKSIPGLFTDFVPDVIYLDGFSFYQTTLLPMKVTELTNHRKEMSDAREEGFVYESQDWGMIKNKSIQHLQAFLTIKAPDGTSPIKVVTCLADVKLKGTGNVTDGSKAVYSKKPYLQGAAGLLSASAFSVVIQTKVSAPDDKGRRTYTYVTQGHESTFAKNRGFNFAAEEDSFLNIWRELTKNIEKKEED